MLQYRQYGAAANKQNLLMVMASFQLPFVSPDFLKFRLIIVPRTTRQVKVNFLKMEGSQQTSFGFGCEKNTVADHKLRWNVIDLRAVRELHPQRSPNRFSSPCIRFKCSVDVVNKVISLINCVSDCCLYSLRLQPRFTIRGVNMRMSTEEWEPSTQLVESYKEIVSYVAIKSRYVSASKGMTCNR